MFMKHALLLVNTSDKRVILSLLIREKVCSELEVNLKITA
jgi:hypothetical protein